MTTTLQLTDLRRLTDAGLAAAAETGAAMNLAIVDAGGRLLHFVRMDGAWPGSVDIALKKAETAALFRMPSAALGELSQPGGPIYGIEMSNGGLVTFGGGLPLIAPDGTVPGAVGVSGGTVTQDTTVATAMTAAF
jgi:uncharacterized protein GlcG (DUF336 family)